jgi:23S rRNA pseudoU1915 N3-methylase RlmH
MVGIIITLMALGLGGMALLMVHKWVKDDNEMKKLKLQKEANEVEIEQMDTKIKLLEEENKKYDRIINESNKMVPEDNNNEKILLLQMKTKELEMEKMAIKIKELEEENKKHKMEEME